MMHNDHRMETKGSKLHNRTWSPIAVLLVLLMSFTGLVSGGTATVTNPGSIAKISSEAEFSYEGVEEQLHYWATRTNTQSNVLQLVAHRELFLGCYGSFEEYLSPMFHTLIILPKDIYFALHVNELLMTESLTAGLHIFLTGVGIGGSHYARKIAEQFISNELEPAGIEVRYINSIDCNIHQLPKNHSKFASTEQLTLRMERDFDISKKMRRVGLNIETNYDSEGYPFDPSRNRCHHSCSAPIPMGKMKVLAMIPVLFEDPSLENLSEEMGIFHGRDELKWWRGGAWENKQRNLTNAALPWIFDKSADFEAHAVMYDLEALRSVKQQYFAVTSRSFPDENHFIGEFARQNNYTLIRNNDVPFQVDFAHFTEPLEYPDDLDLDWFKERNLEELVSHRNPPDQFENWERVHQNIPGMASINNGPYTRFLFYHFRKKAWLPSIFDDGKKKPVSNPTAFKIVELMLKYCGYKFQGKLPNGMFRFELEQVYPGTRLVGFDSHEGKNKRALTFLYPNGESKTLYVDHWKTGPPPKGTKGFVEIPEDATIDRNGFHFRD